MIYRHYTAPSGSICRTEPDLLEVRRSNNVRPDVSKDWIVEYDPTDTYHIGSEFTYTEIVLGCQSTCQAWEAGMVFRNRRSGKRVRIMEHTYRSRPADQENGYRMEWL